MSFVFCFLSHVAQPSCDNRQEAISLPKRISPMRIAARRKREIMVIIANEKNGGCI